MEMERLIVNIGSSSKKYALYLGDELILSCHFEHEESSFVVTISYDDKVTQEKINKESFNKAIVYFLDIYKKQFNKSKISTIGVRVVAPGDYFRKHRIIDEEYIEKLNKSMSMAPIHIKATLDEIKLLKKTFPKSKLIAASDSAFHSSMKEVASSYGVSDSLSETYNIKRFGYHGLSVNSVVNKLEDYLNGYLPKRLLVIHLGSGCSITAIKDGETVDTSMGFTPLEGLLMSTRSGSFDPSLVLFLMERGMTASEMEKIFNKESGLLGVSNSTDDMREIIELYKKGDKKAQKAFDLFIYQIIKYVGAYTAVLGGLDAIVFTGTIGERSFIVRERIAFDLQYLGLTINKTINDKTDGSTDKITEIGAKNSKVLLCVVPTDESRSILEAIDSV